MRVARISLMKSERGKNGMVYTEMYSEKVWGEDVEEIELRLSDRMPDEDTRGVMVFIL